MRCLTTLWPVIIGLVSYAQTAPIVVPLWESGAPGSESRKNEPEQAQDWWVRNVHNPSISVFLPEDPNGSAVLICPGGGHRTLVFKGEGTQTATFLNTLGITGIVLKYRLFREKNSPYTRDTPKQDALRALRLIRSRAADWGVDPDRIGIMGFSAGGEVVNMVAFDDNPGNSGSDDPIERERANPNFQIQIYPGPLGVPETVDSTAIPAFLLVSNKDACCSDPVVKLLNAYRKAGADVEVHIYAKGDHAFNMGDRSSFKTIRGWPQRLSDWLTDNAFFLDR